MPNLIRYLLIVMLVIGTIFAQSEDGGDAPGFTKYIWVAIFILYMIFGRKKKKTNNTSEKETSLKNSVSRKQISASEARNAQGSNRVMFPERHWEKDSERPYKPIEPK